MFVSLRSFNYRIWTGGAVVSNIGTWVQRTAQDWLVLTQLTHHSAVAVGIVMALQTGPQLMFLPWTGFAADYLDRRKLLMVTQGAMALLALILGTLTLTGSVQLWHVYVFAFLSGVVTAFDAPARQVFVSDLVGDSGLPNAIALNATSFNAARMVGPAVGGICIAAWGTGWAFLINGASFAAVLCSLKFIRVGDLHRHERVSRGGRGVIEGFRYVSSRPDLRANIAMLFLIGTFGMNFPIFISTMSVSVFHANASQYGLLNSIMAIGTIAGALLAAAREKPRFEFMVLGAAIFGTGFALAAISPNFWLFGAMLVVIGVAAFTFTNSGSTLMQLTTHPTMRGRVMAMRLAISLGATPVGAPVIGWIADRYGPRWALGVGVAAGLSAAAVGLRYLIVHRHLRLALSGGRLALSLDPSELVAEALRRERSTT